MKCPHPREVQVTPDGIFLPGIYFGEYAELYEASVAYERQCESERQLRKLCCELCEKMQEREYVDIPSSALHTLLSHLDVATKCLERLRW